ncbi:MaoC/PaaZ C-terminal domain-containing protein [Nocardioides zeae]|uniref:MaoC family dehydratase n=1 Tax=Nocardioides zeae TaxID=1457234 RepID=A0A6P0HM97_9ACTN|nr:MaoC family dehydratase [Nocardioides zeae]
MPESFTSIADLEASVGRQLGPTPWRMLTQEEVDAFAALTGDENWIHVDRERAARGPFGGTIAHGYLTLALVPAFGHQLFSLDDIDAVRLNYGLDKVRFPRPVPTGARLRARAEVVRLTRVATGRQLTVRYTLEIEGEAKPACVADMVTLIVLPDA